MWRSRRGSRTGSEPPMRNRRSSLNRHTAVRGGTMTDMGVDDMIKLGELTEENVFKNLATRYEISPNTKHFSIYTYTGTILVAINPYRPLAIYGRAFLDLYQNKRLGVLPPHVFAIADNAYQQMLSTKQQQCCIITGESGAGKTESAKQFLKFITAVSSSQSGSESWIEEQIVQADRIFEAIGCAATVRNNNSSRFGKYFDIKFNGGSGLIEGAVVDTYLLEQSRIVQSSVYERNYHIFYRLLSAASTVEFKRLGLDIRHDYPFLMTTSKETTREDDQDGWSDVRAALQVLLFQQGDQANLFEVLASIIHLGNVTFDAVQSTGGSRTSGISSDASLKYVETLLGVPIAVLRLALTQTITVARGETITKPSNVGEATTARNSLAKALYNKLFRWIRDKINAVLQPPASGTSEGGEGEGGRDEQLCVGVLDVYGFEVFDTNSFEQLCINFWNEHMQQYFLAHIFKLEQSAYEEEGIDWHSIVFTDNQCTLDLLSEAPGNIFALIDDESKVFGERSDNQLLEKLRETCSDHPDFLKSQQPGDREFGIQHFAGQVYYHVGGFLEKNREAFSGSILNALAECSNQFVVNLFADDLAQGKMTRKRAPTVSMQFKTSLKGLIRRLHLCQPFFIRCIKPNEKKLPHRLDHTCVLRQLRYCGILATIAIRKSGFPIQRSFEEFRKRYWMIAPLHMQHLRVPDVTLVGAVCQDHLGDPALSKVGLYHMGKTRVFLKDQHDRELERIRTNTIRTQVVIIQRFIRGTFARKALAEQRAAMILVLRRLRAYAVRQNFIAQLYPRYLRSKEVGEHEGNQQNVSVSAIPFTETTAQHPQTTTAVTRADFTGDGVNPVHRRRRHLLDDVGGASLLQGRYNPATFAGDAAEFFDKQRRVERLKAEIQEVVRALADIPQLESEDLPMSEYAAKHFVSGVSDSYTSALPNAPLLSTTGVDIAPAALSAWSLLLLFTGDLEFAGGVLTPTKRRRRSSTGRQPSKRSGSKSRRPSVRERKASSSKLLNTLAKAGFTEVLGTDSPMQLVCAFFRIALKNPSLHEECMCQIAQQVCQNPDPESLQRSWIMLALGATCLAYSDDLAQSILRMIVGAPSNSVATLAAMTLRQNGGALPRLEPPGWLEFQAAKRGVAPTLSIELPAGASRRVVTVAAPSRLRPNALRRAISDSVGLADASGWAVFIEYRGRHEAVQGRYVFDALSLTETLSEKEQRYSVPWKLVFRREYFPAWHEPKLDPTASALFYSQFMADIVGGRVNIDSHPRLADFLAKRYYVEFGPDADEERLMRVLPDWVPAVVLVQHPAAWWCKTVTKLLESSVYSTKRVSSAMVMANVARIARNVDCYFRNVPALLRSQDDAALPCLIRLNHTGIKIGPAGVVLVDLQYYQILWVDFAAGTADGSAHDLLTLQCMDGRSVRLSGASLDMACEEIQLNLNGLRALSRVGLAMVDSSATQGDTLPFAVGDIIVFPSISARQQATSMAQHAHDSRIGIVQCASVHILASLTVPDSFDFQFDKDMLEAMIAKEGRLPSVHPALVGHAMDPPRAFARYAEVNFSAAVSPRSMSPTTTDVHEVGGLPRVLHSVLLDGPLHNSAVVVARAVARYTTLVSLGAEFLHVQTATAPAHAVITPAMETPQLSDEVYCQILLHMFRSGNVKRATELLWLCSDHVTPSPTFLPVLLTVVSEVQELLRVRLRTAPQGNDHATQLHIDALAACLVRLKHAQIAGPRKQPPHAAEVAYIRSWSPTHRDRLLEQDFVFPNGDTATVQVESRSTVKHVLLKLSEMAGIATVDGLAILARFPASSFVEAGDVGFWDSLHAHQSALLEETKGILVDGYSLLVIRLGWTHVNPGDDCAADKLLHFDHEREEYLRGHRGVPLDTIGRLSVLLHAVRMSKVVSDLIPSHIINTKSTREWQKVFNHAYKQSPQVSESDAVLEFLTACSQTSSFGSFSFSVRQNTSNSLPEELVLLLSDREICLSEATADSTELVRYPLARLSKWSADSNYVHLLIESGDGAMVQHLLQTQSGEQIADMLRMLRQPEMEMR